MAIINKIKGLVQHQGFRRYAANTSWMMAEQMLRIVAGLLVGIWVARYLGPEQFGLFSYVLAFTAIFAGIAKLGLDGILVRELINQPQGRDVYLGTAFWLKVIGAFVVMAIMAAVVPFTSNDSTTNLYIFIIAAGLVFQSFEVVEFYFQSQVLAKVVSICKVIQLALSSAIKVYLVLTQADLFWFVCVTAFDTVSLALSYYVAYKIRGNVSFLRSFKWPIAKQLLKDSWPIVMSSLVVMVYMRADQIILREILGEYSLGIYSASYRLVEAVFFIPAIISASLFPYLAEARNRGDEHYEKVMIDYYRFVFWIGVFISLFLILWHRAIISILYGEAYSDTAAVLFYHAFSIPFVFLFVASGKWIVLENFTILSFYRNSIAALFSLLLNINLIPVLGVSGAAISMTFSFILSSLIFDALGRKTHSQFLIKCKAILWVKK